MRSRTRIKPILELIEQIWELNPDLRLGQLLDNANVNRYSEDVNVAVEQLCKAYNLPFRYHALWGVRPSLDSVDVVYKKLDTLTTSHLKNILKNAHPSRSVKNAIFELLEDRGEFEDDESDEECETCANNDYDDSYIFPRETSGLQEDDRKGDGKEISSKTIESLNLKLEDFRDFVKRLKQE